MKFPDKVVWQSFNGTIEALPDCANETFDLCFSIACFEHVLTLRTALAKIAAPLRNSGQLFSKFCPIWSASDGHHLRSVKDRNGEVYDLLQLSIPPWGICYYHHQKCSISFLPIINQTGLE